MSEQARLPGERGPLAAKPAEGSAERLPRAARLASALFVIPGLGFAVTTAAILVYDARRHELPMTPFGWRLLGGPYEQIGRDTLRGLGRVFATALIGVSVLDLVAGIWLRQGRRRGARLGVATTPIMLVLGTLFVVPALWILPPVRAILAISSWRRLR